MVKKKVNTTKKIAEIVNKQLSWFSLKSYSHFDRPVSFMNLKQDINKLSSKRFVLTKRSQEKLISKIDNLKHIISKDEVAKHSFYPFIGFDINERRGGIVNKIKYYKKKLLELTGEEREKCQKNLVKLKQKGLIKLRPIRYSAHFDGYIYSYYAQKLYEKYETKINNLDLNDEILAYRKLPAICLEDKELKPNNCTMAKSIFDEISRRNCNCIALAFDISSFYDNIDHANLKQAWIDLLEVKELPTDHYNIFKSLTKYSYVDLKEICYYFNSPQHEYCGMNCCKRCKKQIMNQLPKPLFKKAQNFRKFRNWYKKEFNQTFRKNIGLTDTENPYGIPQGTAMSALLSNIYMIPFDKKMKELANSVNGVYRRYSDDIMFICPPGKENKELVISEIKKAIKERGAHLEIHNIDDWDKYSKSKCYDFTSEEIKKDPLQYLGFLFDGERVKIRDGSLARYMRKSKRAVTATKKNTLKKLQNMYKKGLKIEDKHEKLYRRTLYARYTHLGKRNFISYAYRAFNNFDDTTIKKQVKNHFKRLEIMIRSADNEIAKFCESLSSDK